MKHLKILALAAITVLLFACQKDNNINNNNGGNGGNTNTDEIEITENQRVQTLSADAIGASVIFSTKGAWTATLRIIPQTGSRIAARIADGDWIDIAPESGNAGSNNTINITLDPNTTEEAREAEIIIESNGESVTIEITQSSKDDGGSVDWSNHPYLNPNLTYGSVKDIDGNVYPTIQIDTQIWMAENLKTTRYNDSTLIPNVTDGAAWANLSTGAWCNYDNDPANGTIYGKLYNWYAVNTDNLCPKGWHIPTDAEWGLLINYLGGAAENKMKATGNSSDGSGLWESPNAGTNESGFTALPSSGRLYDGQFLPPKFIASWWSASEYDIANAWYRFFGYGNQGVVRNNTYNNYGYSCRCIQD
jgi:uncharacterized protein (TIGR02145 family)